MRDCVQAATDAIRQEWPQTPQFALVLGTGLGHIAEQVNIEATLPYDQLPGFTRTTAIAHRGQLICGRLLGVPLMLLDGRCHLYEGYSYDEVTFPIRTVAACGATTLIVTNASGGLNYSYVPGDIMVIDDQIDLLGEPAQRHSRTRPPLRPHRPHPTPYDSRLSDLALRAAAGNQITAHRGVYAAVTGPNYETRAEYEFLRRIGADVVGMSTVPEVQVASRLEMRVLGLSIVTNVAHLQSDSTINGWHVVNAAERAEPHVRQILERVIGSLNG